MLPVCCGAPVGGRYLKRLRLRQAFDSLLRASRVGRVSDVAEPVAHPCVISSHSNQSCWAEQCAISSLNLCLNTATLGSELQAAPGAPVPAWLDTIFPLMGRTTERRYFAHAFRTSPRETQSGSSLDCRHFPRSQAPLPVSDQATGEDDEDPIRGGWGCNDHRPGGGCH